MNSSDRRELEAIKTELRDIIKEMDGISRDIRNNRNISGVGHERCANVVTSHADKCRRSLSRLENMNTTILSPEFAQKALAKLGLSKLF